MREKVNLEVLSDELKDDIVIYDLSYQTPLSSEYNHYTSQETLKHIRNEQLFDLIFRENEKEI